MNVTSASNPIYADPANRTIRLSVLFAGAQGPVSYVAADGDEASQDLFDDAASGRYGAVAAYGHPAAPLPASALRAYAGAKVERLRAEARSYRLAEGLSVNSDAMQGTGADLIGLLNWGTANPAATTNFVQNNGGVVTLTGAQCSALAMAVLAYGQSVYATLAQAMNGIANETLTTTAALDALAWPT